jgi:hypothetical protein
MEFHFLARKEIQKHQQLRRKPPLCDIIVQNENVRNCLPLTFTGHCKKNIVLEFLMLPIAGFTQLFSSFSACIF